MERTGRWEILAGTAGVATPGALAVGAAGRSLTRRHPTTDPDSIEESTAVIGVAECSHMVMMQNLRAVNDAMSGLVGRVQRP
jgi:hypothetical protein